MPNRRRLEISRERHIVEERIRERERRGGGRERTRERMKKWRERLPAADPPEKNMKKLQDLHELVKINLARSYHQQEKQYNLRRRDWRPTVGEWVWKREHPLSKKETGFNAKLAPRYSGPYEVRRIISPVIVDLRNKSKKWQKHVHIRDLKRDRSSQEDEEIDEENTAESGTE